MSLRRTGADAAAAELARRRLSLLGAELAAAPPDPALPPAEDEARCASAAAAGDPAEAGGGRRGGRHAAARLGVLSRLALRAADGLPPGLHGRFRVTAQHVTVVALMLATATALAAWLLVRSAPAEVIRSRQASLVLPSTPPPPAPPVVPVADAGATMPPPAVATTGQSLLVHVTGKVRSPGVVELPAGARVVDALEAAGGALPGARLGTLNLARPLVDGEQVAVAVPAAILPMAPPAPSTGVPPPTPVTSGTAPDGLVNLNTATTAELEELPGVGPVTAAGIIEWRTQHGGFSSVDELIEVSGIGEVTLAELRDLVTV